MARIQAGEKLDVYTSEGDLRGAVEVVRIDGNTLTVTKDPKWLRIIKGMVFRRPPTITVAIDDELRAEHERNWASLGLQRRAGRKDL